jgi:hypothetical protein
VYQNGVKLVNGDDYTASDGATVTLATGAATGDSIVIVASFPRGLSDGYLKSEADAKYALIASPTFTGVATFAKGTSNGITIGDVSTNSNSVLRLHGTSAGRNWQIANNLNVAGIEFTPSTANGGTTYTTPTVTFLSSGNVGVGTTSPSARLHVSTSGTGIQEVEWLNNAQAVGADVGSAMVFTGTSSNNGLARISGAFSGATTADGAYMAFSTRAVTSGTLTERVRLDASGNFGVGTTSPSSRLDVRTAATTSAAVATFSRSDAAVSATIYYDGSDGCMSYGTTTNHPIAFRTNNTERARIDSGGTFSVTTVAGRITKLGGTTSVYLSTGDTHGDSATFSVIGADSGAATFAIRLYNGSYWYPFQFKPNGAMSVGGATPTTSGAGITFPATQSASTDANTLDDYEEGTWTPHLRGDGSNPTVTYTTQSGYYTKIGNIVYASALIQWSAISGGSGNFVVNMPFPGAGDNSRGVGSVPYNTGVNFGQYGLCVHSNIASGNCYFIKTDNNQKYSGYVAVSDVTATGVFQIAVVYKA